MTFLIGEVDARTSGQTADWRDEFGTVAPWAVTGSGHLASLSGNAAGSRFLVVTLDPRQPGAWARVTAPTRRVTAPFRVGFAATLSRRSAFQSVCIGLAGADAAGAPVSDGQSWPTLSATGGIVVVSNVATLTTATAHGLYVGQRIAVAGNADPRANGFYLVTGIPTSTTLTVALTIADGTYGTTSTIDVVDPSAGSADWLGVHLHDGTSGNATAVTRSGSLTPWATAWNPGSTWDAGTVPSSPVNYSTPYAIAVQPRYTMELLHEVDWCGPMLTAVDSTSAITAQSARDQNIPRPDAGFVPLVDIRNLPHTPVPVGNITAAVKSGTTTATLTIANHGLTTTDRVFVYGIRDQANFANQATAVQVASVVDANTVTLAFGASATASSYGGTLYRAQASTAPVGLSTSSVQSIAPSNGRLQLTYSGTMGTYTVGEAVLVTGLVDSTGTSRPEYAGLYRIASTNTSTFRVELDPLAGQAVPGSSINAGGLMQAAPELRLHFVRGSAHTRVYAEIESGRGHSRSQSSIPVTFANGPSVAITGTPTVNATSTPATPTAHTLTAAASTNATSIKTTAGTLYSIIATNYSAATKYLKLYNKASAPSVGGDVPLATIPLPATSCTPIEFGAVGVRFGTGIALALTGAMADSDTTALAAGDVKTFTSYI